MNEVKKIGKIRKQLGLTQKQLADLSGVSQSLIAKIESNKIDPAYSKVVQIMNALEEYQKKEKKLVSQVMTKKIYSVTSRDTVSKTIKIMREEDISQLPVIENGNCIGSVSESAILGVLTDEENPKDVLIDDIMDDAFPSIPANSIIDVATDLLKHYPALLVEKNGEIIGIITKADLLKAI